MKLTMCYQEQLLLSNETGKVEQFRKNWSGFGKLF